MAYSHDEVRAAFDRALCAAALVDRPAPDPNVHWVPHQLDWLEDAHGWMTPMGEEVWVPATLISRPMMVNQRLTSPCRG